MRILYYVCVSILSLTTIAFTQLAGTFYKVKNLQSIQSNEPVIQEDTINCARESSCQSIKRILPSNVNQPFKESTKSTIYFEKMMPDEDPVYPSCIEAIRRNWQKVGIYRIRHSNMVNSVIANCSSTEGKVIASFHHDAETQITVEGYEAPKSYREAITYEHSLGNIRHFVDSSFSCRQFVRIECNHMRLSGYAALIDGNSTEMKYFGGGPQNGSGCKCGITNSCATSGKSCNCDSNDNVWRYDEGYITEKQRLPLTEVRLGDTGNSGEQGKFVVGPLECSESQL